MGYFSDFLLEFGLELGDDSFGFLELFFFFLELLLQFGAFSSGLDLPMEASGGAGGHNLVQRGLVLPLHHFLQLQPELIILHLDHPVLSLEELGLLLFLLVHSFQLCALLPQRKRLPKLFLHLHQHLRKLLRLLLLRLESYRQLPVLHFNRVDDGFLLLELVLNDFQLVWVCKGVLALDYLL
mmetsp:Transcript_31959/g.31225  ORF Transcript_31959/g.31225 Transcript_31959/m.31225 type:complete len:182 (-) Transcript_31959:796-1341(-)